MTSLAAALLRAGLEASADVQAELAVRAKQESKGHEVAPGVTFKSNFDISLLSAIEGPVDCRVYLDDELEYSESTRGARKIEQFIRTFLASNPNLGSMTATVRDILSIQEQSGWGRTWVAVLCRNAHIAWDITTALRAKEGWPAPIGKITCPKVEQLMRQESK